MNPFDAGIPLFPQPWSSALAWPKGAAIPLPRGAIAAGELGKLRLYEDGKPILATFEAVDCYDISNGDVRWLHVNALWRQGAKYDVAFSQDRVHQRGDNHTRRLLVGKVLAGGGPQLFDDVGRQYRAQLNGNVHPLTFERIGPSYAVTRIEGDFAGPDGPSPARFILRLYEYANSPLVKVEWHTIFRKPRETRYAAIGFPVTSGLPLLRNAGLKAPQCVRVGGLLSYVWAWPPDNGPLDEDAFSIDNLHQLKWWHQGRVLDLALPDAAYQSWKANDQALKPNVEGTALAECKPEYARDGLFCGHMFVEFAVVFEQGLNEPKWQALYAQNPAVLPSSQFICDSGVIGPVAPAGDPLADPFEDAIRAALKAPLHAAERCGLTGWMNLGNVPEKEVKRLDGTGNRSHGHRPCNAEEHYGGWLQLWHYVLLDGGRDSELLKFARRGTDHQGHIAMCRFDAAIEAGAAVPSARDHIPGTFFHDKAPTPFGSDFDGTPTSDDHLGLLGHWVNPDSLLMAWLVDGCLWAKDAYDQWSAAMLSRAHIPTSGLGREINQILGRLITLYEYGHQPAVFNLLRLIAHGLTAATLVKQASADLPRVAGALFDPLALVRYYELTGDKDVGAWLVQQSADIRSKWLTDLPGLNLAMMPMGPQLENIYAIALSALAYQMTGDDAHLSPWREFPARFAGKVKRNPLPQWDGFGTGPGPLGDGLAPLQWGRMQKQLARAG